MISHLRPSVGLFYVGTLVLFLVSSALAQPQSPPPTREGFAIVLQDFLKANPTIKDEREVFLSNPQVTSSEVREYARQPESIRGLARVAYQTADPQPNVRHFEIVLKYLGKRWSFSEAFSITSGKDRDLLSSVGYFVPPADLQPVVLEGEHGKPVTTTPSGLKYVVLDGGKGPKPHRGQMIVAEYTGWLTDGTKFDSSKDHPTEFKFKVGSGLVIPGWDEALLDMKVGERRKLILPPQLAYGEQGIGPIPPNATLIFEVKLVRIITE